MAENEDGTEKTEDPTGKRLGDAEGKGQIAKSQEFNHWVMLLGAGLVMAAIVDDVVPRLAGRLVPFLERPHDFAVAGLDMRQIIIDLVIDIGVILTPLFLLMVFAALGANVLQHKPILSSDRLKPKLSNISLMKGIKKKFSPTTITEFLKSMVKLLVIGGAVIAGLAPRMEDLPLMVTFDIADLLEVVRQDALLMLGIALVIMGIIAAADFLYQKYSHLKSLRMTKQEVKDEHKQSEGDPVVKRQLAKIRFERARQRMMAAIPRADVVITNPTHFAVALQYDQETMIAPVVLAKGQDLIALKIRELAEEHSVPIVENPPLARGLYQAVEVDQQIPVEFYKAVAEIIGYVMGLKRKPVRRLYPSTARRERPRGPGYV